jgi:hypothetical protein
MEKKKQSSQEHKNPFKGKRDKMGPGKRDKSKIKGTFENDGGDEFDQAKHKIPKGTQGQGMA